MVGKKEKDKSVDQPCNDDTTEYMYAIMRRLPVPEKKVVIDFSGKDLIAVAEYTLYDPVKGEYYSGKLVGDLDGILETMTEDKDFLRRYQNTEQMVAEWETHFEKHPEEIGPK